MAQLMRSRLVLAGRAAIAKLLSVNSLWLLLDRGRAVVVRCCGRCCWWRGRRPDVAGDANVQLDYKRLEDLAFSADGDSPAAAAVADVSA